MPEDNLGALTRSLLHSEVVRWTLVLFTLGISVTAIAAATVGGIQQAGELGSVAAALATILLVTLTSQYAEQTRQLVKETELDRAQRKEEKQDERQREVDALRRALRTEIGKVRYFDELSDEYEVNNSAVGVPIASTIYETNASKIGLLTDEEIDNIVEYYTRLDIVSELIELQRERDTIIEMGPLEELYRRFEALIEKAVRKFTLGYLDPSSSQKRVQEIRKQFSKLSDAQSRALSAIDENLEDNQNKK